MIKRKSLNCVIRGCDNLGKVQSVTSIYKKGPFKGQRRRGSLCDGHVKKKIAKKKGISVAEYRKEILEKVASNKGMTPNEYRNSLHPYKKYRKKYCENIDGRLGYVCDAIIIDYEYQLEVDHIDENHNNNDPDNLQTLCANDHRLKTKHYRRNDVDARILMHETILKTRKKSENN
tara:strand:+ start:1055 stop:1579 length:525 start_codon:yes stop_codon:yes gene_type:complete